jgi:hypothetical protein
MDYFTKWPIAKAMPNQNADRVAAFIQNNIICQHGCPKQIQSDNGTPFRNQWIPELAKRCGIKHIFSTSYHPQSNGLVECYNQTLCDSLRSWVWENPTDWDLHVDKALFSYRTRKQSSTGFSPFELVYGIPGRLPIDLKWDLPDQPDHPDTLSQCVAQLLTKLEPARLQTTESIKIAQRRQKATYDKKVVRPRTFHIGDKVLRINDAKTAKLDPTWEGPYFVHQVLPHEVYKLRKLNGKLVRNLENGDRLKHYKERALPPASSSARQAASDQDSDQEQQDSDSDQTIDSDNNSEFNDPDNDEPDVAKQRYNLRSRKH